MSISTEISEHLLLFPERQEENFAAAMMTLPYSFSGFQGHFPGNPTLPGVCLIMSFKELIRRSFGADAENADLRGVKFFSPSVPGDLLELECRQNGSDYHCSCRSGDRKICSMKLILKGESL